MNKKILKNAIVMAIMMLFVPAMATAQLTIGGEQSPRATLDVRAMQGNTDLPQGIIPPQFTFAELQALEGNYISIAGTPGAELNGTIVFVSCVAARPAAGGYHPIMTNVTAPGLYFFDYFSGGNTRRWRAIAPPADEAVPTAMIITLRGGTNITPLVNALLPYHDRIYVSVYGDGDVVPIFLANGVRRAQSVIISNSAAGGLDIRHRGLRSDGDIRDDANRSIGGHSGRGGQFTWMPGTACPGHWMVVY